MFLVRKILSLAVLITLLFIGHRTFQFFTTHAPVTSSLENIHGIAYPQTEEGVLVLEQLAHADLELPTTNFAQAATLEITFTPGDIVRLDVGIRENSFWLSYPWQQLYQRQNSTDPTQPITRRVTIPLTDKLPDQKDTIDLMFFATTDPPQASESTKEQDTTKWLLNDLKITVAPANPSLAEIKDFIRSKITREKPL